MDADDDFQAVLSFVERRYGFATSQYSKKYLKRRVDSRLRRNGIDPEAYGEYLALLEGDDGEERAELLDTLSVNVTSFFRNTEVWDRIGDVLRTLQAERSFGVSAWSVPCSDGREPYSLAMLASDADDISTRTLSIRGSDIDEEALERARAGVYYQRNTSNVESELSFLDDYSRYVERDDDVFRVRPTVREMVHFDRHDLISDDADDEYDLVFCRNFFIYVDAQFKLPVLRKLDESIRSGGYLVLGKTESIPYELKDRFDPVAKELRIYRRR
ncbi:CheR family methyltransferase [Natrialbaceae archaeon GCM10025810]|uniref:CheR family methyltransferase n=1 Tax=Halovalidus salilacus TaxID=3075124 RepID=UPI0036134B2F